MDRGKHMLVLMVEIKQSNINNASNAQIKQAYNRVNSPKPMQCAANIYEIPQTDMRIKRLNTAVKALELKLTSFIPLPLLLHMTVF